MNSFVCVANFKWPSQSFYIFYILQTVNLLTELLCRVLYSSFDALVHLHPHPKHSYCARYLFQLDVFSRIWGFISSPTWWHEVSETLTSSEPERTVYQLVPMSPWRYTREEGKEFALFLLWTADIGFRGETVRWLTGDAFLQALVEATQANLVQQTGVEPLEGLHIFQTCHNYVNIFPRALRWSGGINRRGQCTECS